MPFVGSSIVGGRKEKVDFTKRSADADSVILFEAFEDFMQEKAVRSLSKSTLRNYRQSFDFFCKYAEFTEKTLTEEVDVSDVYSMINTLNHNGVQPSSINHYIRDLFGEETLLPLHGFFLM